MRQALDVLQAQGAGEDLVRIRKALDENKVDVTVRDIGYLGDHGDKHDIERISRLTAVNRSTTTAFRISSSLSYVKEAAAAILRVSGGNLRELMDVNIPAPIRASVIAQSSKSQLEALSEAKLLVLLNDDSDQVRKSTALRCVTYLKKATVLRLLKTYTERKEYRYYNVIFWLDLMQAFSARFAREIALRALGALIG